MLSEHIWRSTRDMAPGPRAAAADSNGSGGWRYDEDTGEPVPSNDPAGESATTIDRNAALHAEYRTLLSGLRHADRALHDFVQRMRPDRTTNTGDPSTDSDYCRHHLETLGTCEPRYRGDTCRTCYDFDNTYHRLPPVSLLRHKHDGGKWNERMIADALRAEKGPTKAGRKKRKSRAA
jgi:hypothetical protein